jgi:uncharacterized protein YciI
MTTEQVITIKKYVEGAYSTLKTETDNDLVWIDMLKDQEYYGILESAKKYIRSGNKFPPTIGELIKGYEIVIDEFNKIVFEMMADDGYFVDRVSKEKEVRDWNTEKRTKQTKIWLSKNYPKEYIPEWFLSDWKKYANDVKQLLANNNLQMISG